VSAQHKPEGKAAALQAEPTLVPPATNVQAHPTVVTSQSMPPSVEVVDPLLDAPVLATAPPAPTPEPPPEDDALLVAPEFEVVVVPARLPPLPSVDPPAAHAASKSRPGRRTRIARAYRTSR
jgi:hypothetical protein